MTLTQAQQGRPLGSVSKPEVVTEVRYDFCPAGAQSEWVTTVTTLRERLGTGEQRPERWAVLEQGPGCGRHLAGVVEWGHQGRHPHK